MQIASICLYLLLVLSTVDSRDIIVDGSRGQVNCTGASDSPCPTIVEAFKLIERQQKDENFVVLLVGDVSENDTAILSTIPSTQGLTILVKPNATEGRLSINGYNGTGFQIDVEAHIVFERVRLVQHGVAIRMSAGIIEARDSEFNQNGLSVHQINGKTIFSMCSFVNNRETLRFEGGSSTLDSISVANNTNSGPIFSVSGMTNVTLKTSTVSGNENTRDDSIFNVMGGRVDILSSNFTNNRANGTAGAISVANATLSIYQGNFTGNFARFGGAVGIYKGAIVNLTLTIFSLNNATDVAGALFINEGYVNVQNCSFSKNRAAKGGAVTIYNALPNPINMTHCNFTGNSASEGNDLWMLYDSNVLLNHLVATQNNQTIYCTSPATNSTKTTNQYCESTCRSPQCAFCPGLCLLDNSNDLDNSGAGGCYSSMQRSCSGHGICRLAQKNDDNNIKKSFAQCECNATYGSDSCNQRSWLFYVLIVLSGLVAVTIVLGLVFTIQNRLRRKWGYHSLN
ncbi:hypothetical protein PROFUN_12882 [Planoprotostelium fungivorum]|uniref:Polymorphic outer membrane protein n=1 Tax=Planoprotostelium fungivorum TaxID=1890364 RepID=A0A2P6MWK6_9EUKA|nr:hypothetical protein PROFUN_12882 [Planoprotostelium fungivorum]